MEIDLVRGHKLPNGEAITFTDVCVADSLISLDAFTAAAVARQAFLISLAAARLQTVFIASNQAVTLHFNGTSGVQSVTITGGPTGGTFTLTYSGSTTTAIAYNASAATVQAALQALTSIGLNNATVGGSPGGPYTVTFAGTLALQAIGAMTASGAGLTGGSSPGVTIATVAAGSAPTFSYSIAANNPMEWARQDGYFANPITADVTMISVTNGGTSSAKVNLRFGQNAS